MEIKSSVHYAPRRSLTEDERREATARNKMRTGMIPAIVVLSADAINGVCPGCRKRGLLFQADVSVEDRISKRCKSCFEALARKRDWEIVVRNVVRTIWEKEQRRAGKSRKNESGG